ncbi:uncharacterized protein DUF3105 [Actinomadura pelletieri DSM 43383]|uniref:Uncharacterized protein DUF3105 n=1 Tax=Actinomadura pelletieri DSM 43383 TaxID=1120940 RepID=A0A495Q9A3_9ACTN|nr:DUF3105 domain-containing protein [Actinomadura pelletieri]RKS67832.1 uncharacterized protein DUF3105 [Actinomadura pelletieri DSM 43383]
MSKSARNKNARSNNARGARQNALTQRETPWGPIVFFTVVGLVAVIAIGYAFVQSRPSSADDRPSIAGLVTKDDLDSGHTSAPVEYATDPPMGGDHHPTWQNCNGRVYDAALRNENAVHSLEHGAVWITYRPGLPAAQLDVLKGKVTRTDYTFMSPYPSLDSPIVLSAWGNQLKIDDASDPRVDKFLRAFVKGPQTLEPGAPCDGAKDTP